jgi:EAL domain-containing protein (putative c-di-GMP-specific phosphodiesterase class I)
MNSLPNTLVRDQALESGPQGGVDRHRDPVTTPSEIDRRLLALYSQPIVRTTDPGEKTLRAEILIAVVDGERKVLPAAQFLRSAQKKGLSEFIDRFVVSEVVDYLVERSILGLAPMTMCNVNLTGSSLSNPLFEDFLLREIARLARPQQLCFEITETELITNLHATAELMGRLKRLGCRFALDDFGTGFCSFEYLRHLPVDFLKIDGQFIRETPKRSLEYEMVSSMGVLARKLGMQTIAEFVETDDIFATIREMGIDFCQGFLFGRPTPVHSIV